MALTLGELNAIISTDDRPFERGLDRAHARFGRFGDRIKVAAAAAGAAVGAALAIGFGSTLELGKARSKLTAQLGATPAEAERFGQIAGNLYADAWGDSMSDVTAAIDAVRSSIGGLSTASDQQLQATTKHALAFADTFGIDVARAAQVAGQAVKTGLAQDATEAFDLMTAAAQNVPTALREEILNAADEYGQFFSTLGIDGQAAFGLLAAGAAKGQYGVDKTGDAIKEFTIRSTDLSTATRSAFDAIGMDTEAMTNRILAGGDQAAAAFGTIVDGLLGIKDPGQQAAAAIALFGTPLEDLNVSEIPAFLQSLRDGQTALGDTAGKIDEVATTLGDNAATALEGFRRSAKAALVEQLARAVPYIKDVAIWLREHKAIVVPLVAALGTFAAVIGTIIAISKVWTAVQTALNIVMMANPIGLIILAIVALIAGIALLIANWDTVKKAFAAAWDWIWNHLKAFGSWFMDVFWRKGLKRGFDAWLSVVTGVRDRVVAAFRWVQDKAAALRDLIVGIPGRIRSGFSSLWGIITSPFRAAFNAIAGFWNSTVGSLSWSVPGWVPGIGGNTVAAPHLPVLHRGGIVPGGDDMPILARGGEGVFTREQMRALGVMAGGGRDEFVAEATIDLGEGIQQVVELKFRRQNRGLKARALAGAGMAR